MPIKTLSADKQAKKIKKVKPEIAEKTPALHFFEAVGRRKTAIARIHLQAGNSKDFTINDKPLDQYFPSSELQQIALSSLEKMDCLDKFSVTAKVRGGGLHAQAEALRHGIARALTEFSPELRDKIKKTGFLTRDSRMRERKKFGLKRARKAPQWNKR
ncbi:MAG: 30S ribosomal protein S9 [Candidatus Nealsonbacteria bacterium]